MCVKLWMIGLDTRCIDTLMMGRTGFRCVLGSRGRIQGRSGLGLGLWVAFYGLGFRSYGFDAMAIFVEEGMGCCAGHESPLTTSDLPP